jgi:hypothetical protein
MLADGCFELDARKQLQQLAENAAYSIHCGSLASVIWFWLNPPHLSKAFTFVLKSVFHKKIARPSCGGTQNVIFTLREHRFELRSV